MAASTYRAVVSLSPSPFMLGYQKCALLAITLTLSTEYPEHISDSSPCAAMTLRREAPFSRERAGLSRLVRLRSYALRGLSHILNPGAQQYNSGNEPKAAAEFFLSGAAGSAFGRARERGGSATRRPSPASAAMRSTSKSGGAGGTSGSNGHWVASTSGEGDSFVRRISEMFMKWKVRPDVVLRGRHENKSKGALSAFWQVSGV